MIRVRALLCRYQGHTELITSVVPVHHPKGYASCSWDKSVNLWHPHVVDPSTARHHAKLLQCPQDFFNELHGPPQAISEFEKKNPKFIPASLNVCSAQLFSTFCGHVSVAFNHFMKLTQLLDSTIKHE